MSKEARTISELVTSISEEMVRLDYKPSVLKQHHIVWDKLCKYAGERSADDFNMEFGVKFLDEAMRAHSSLNNLYLLVYNRITFRVRMIRFSTDY